jgi:hypothetical protein
MILCRQIAEKKIRFYSTHSFESLVRFLKESADRVMSPAEPPPELDISLGKHADKYI